MIFPSTLSLLCPCYETELLCKLCKHSTVHYLTVETATAQEINLALPVTMTAIVKNCPKINEVFFLLRQNVILGWSLVQKLVKFLCN